MRLHADAATGAALRATLEALVTATVPDAVVVEFEESWDRSATGRVPLPLLHMAQSRCRAALPSNPISDCSPARQVGPTCASINPLRGDTILPDSPATPSTYQEAEAILQRLAGLQPAGNTDSPAPAFGAAVPDGGSKVLRHSVRPPTPPTAAPPALGADGSAQPHRGDSGCARPHRRRRANSAGQFPDRATLRVFARRIARTAGRIAGAGAVPRSACRPARSLMRRIRTSGRWERGWNCSAAERTATRFRSRSA